MTPGTKAYRQVQRALSEASSAPQDAEKRARLRRRLHEIEERLTPFEQRGLLFPGSAHDAGSPGCCG